MHRRLSILLIGLIAATAAAQNPPTSQPTKPADEQKKPVHEPAAKKALVEMMGKLYRPREHGLKDVSAKVTLTFKSATEEKKLNPFTLQWKGDSYRMFDEKNRPVDIKLLARALGSLSERVINDLVGFRSLDRVMGNHLKLDKNGWVRVVVPEWVTTAPFAWMTFETDEKGRAKRQSVYKKDGSLLLEHLFEFGPAGKLFVVKGNTTKVGGKIVEYLSYEHVEVDGFIFPKKLEATDEKFQRIVEYSDIKVNTGLKFK